MLPSGILKLGVSWCCKLEKLPSLSSLKLLLKLSIQGCSELIEIKGLEELKSLGNLSIGGCDKLSNLKGLEHLESLRRLHRAESHAPFMNDDPFQVQCLGRLKNLDILRIDSYHSLERLDISQLTHLMKLIVCDYKNLVDIKCLERLKNLVSLIIEGCDSIETIPPLLLFDNLDFVRLKRCLKLGDVQGLEKGPVWFSIPNGFSES